MLHATQRHNYFTMFYRMFLLTLLALIFSVVSAQDTFTNPIFESNSADPCVYRVGDHYYLTISNNRETEITVYKSETLTNFRNSEAIIAYTTPEGSSDAWASEMHEVDGDLYIYFAMNTIGLGHRPYALKANDPTDPMKGWSDAILMFPENTWETGGIDGTIFKHGNGRTYFVYSWFPRIVIAEMTDPVTPVNATKVLLRVPSQDWERGVNEGPYFIYNKNVSYMVFAIGGSFDDSYGLALMSIDFDKDPMDVNNWWYGDNGPVFYTNEEDSVFGPGHAVFTSSPDNSETWFIYHAHEKNGIAGGHRIARADKITWAEDGKPVFPRPHGYFSPQPVPSGQVDNSEREFFRNPIISGNSPDPSVVLIGDTYYMSQTTKKDSQITLFRSKRLTDFRNAESKVVLPATDCVNGIWSSEIHLIGQELYLYFTYDSCNVGRNIYVMKAADASNPFGDWSSPMRLMIEHNGMTFDPTVLQHGNGKLYLVYSGSRDDGPLGMWIVPMIHPLVVGSSVPFELKMPTLDWEGGVNLGAGCLYKNGVSYLAYSVGSPFGADYMLRLLSLNGSMDPLVAGNWLVKEEAVFGRNDEESVFGTGNPGFTTSPDGTETWMVYHASVDSNNIDGFRVSRAEKIDWDVEGNPIFPKPSGYFKSQPVPSGQL